MTIRVKLTRIGEMLSEIRLENSAGNDIYDNGHNTRSSSGSAETANPIRTTVFLDSV
jgi:hypothetical protein